MNAEQRRAYLEAMVDLFHCPNTGKIIEGMKHDDKVLCGCGKSNPAANEAVQGVVHHVKRLLRRATVDDYLKQEAGRH